MAVLHLNGNFQRNSKTGETFSNGATNNGAANIKDFSRSRATIRLGRDTLESIAGKLAESFSQGGTTNEDLLLCESEKEVEG